MILPYTLGILAAVLAVILLIASMRPNTFRIERSAVINAPPEKIFPLVNDFHNWTQWSPWEHVDPDLKRTYSGAPSGKGATYAWHGDKRVGEGRMDITDSAAPSKVVLRLEFIKPMQAVNTTEFTFAPVASGTSVTWAMFGPAPFMHKLMSTIFSMDKLLGQQFESGLAKMKTAAEAA